MPWVPEYVSAIELVRRQTRAAGQADPITQYVASLTRGDTGAVEDVWPGEVVVYDPRAGEVRGHLGVKIEEPKPLDLDEATLERYTGTYETIAVDCELTAKDGRLVATIKVRPEMAKVLESIGEQLPEEDPTMTLGMISLAGDRFVVVDGDGKGQKGYFVRSDDGEIFGVHLGGRLASRKSEN